MESENEKVYQEYVKIWIHHHQILWKMPLIIFVLISLLLAGTFKVWSILSDRFVPMFLMEKAILKFMAGLFLIFSSVVIMALLNYTKKERSLASVLEHFLAKTEKGKYKGDSGQEKSPEEEYISEYGYFDSKGLLEQQERLKGEGLLKIFKITLVNLRERIRYAFKIIASKPLAEEKIEENPEYRFRMGYGLPLLLFALSLMNSFMAVIGVFFILSLIPWSWLLDLGVMMEFGMRLPPFMANPLETFYLMFVVNPFVFIFLSMLHYQVLFKE